MALLAVVLLISYVARPDPSPISIPGITDPPGPANVLEILFRNSLVLALHAFACVAGYIAGSSLPLSTEQRTGFSRWIHEKARPVAFAWVIAVTCFSLGTQAYVLGSTGATLAYQLHISPAVLMVTVLPHALPELTALFLPLAAWTIASRRGEWGDLLAATLVTVTLAVPTLVCAALWETYVLAPSAPGRLADRLVTETLSLGGLAVLLGLGVGSEERAPEHHLLVLEQKAP